MRLLRSILFWLHLVAGIAAGGVIGVMSFTGAVIAFEDEIVAWAERDVRRVPSPAAGTVALPLDQLVAHAVEASGGNARPADITVSPDPLDAVAVNLGRDAGTRYVNPYTGEVAPVATTRTHDFMHLMIDWHRWLALSGDERATGKAVTGASNLAFLFLALSGLWIWWPRAWSWRALKPSLWFTGARGKARDWNWHNVFGFWSLPVLVVLIVTATVISYPWASNLVYRAFGETPPARGGAPATETALVIERPSPDAPRLGYEQILARLRADHPEAVSITLREGLPRRRGAAAPVEANAGSGGGRRKNAEQPYSATVRDPAAGPTFTPVQLVLNPYTGDALSRSDYSDLSTGRKVRTWMRYLHTGQALGWPGQLIAGLACVGGCVLVYTGFALSWRRFFFRRAAKSAA